MIHTEARQALLCDINNWVLPSLFCPKPKFLHVIIDGDSDSMLAVARQVALLAHFPTFDESNPDKTCTRITILGKNPDSGAWKKSFGNLLTWDEDPVGKISLPLDVKIERVVWAGSAEDWMQSNADIRYEYVKYDEAKIDKLLADNKKAITRMNRRRTILAKRVNSVYEDSMRFELMRADDIANIHEFDAPVRRFLWKPIWKVNKMWNGLSDVNKESSLVMADSLPVRMLSLKLMNPKQKCSKTLVENMVAMSRSEHSRWNVEKLINGFRPYTLDEVAEDEKLSGEARKQFESTKKKDPSQYAHIDICDYNRLQRIDLDSIKYDSFLLLAMVRYWERMLRK